MQEVKPLQTTSKLFNDIFKFNPYHDSRGRFTTAGAAASFTYKPGASTAHSKAIEREKERSDSEKGFKGTLYHGSPNKDIKEFDMSRAGKNTSSGEKLLFFTDSKQMADDFSYERLDGSSKFFQQRGKKGRVYEVDVEMKNPLDFRNLSDKDIDNILKLDGEGLLTRADIQRYASGNHQLLKAGLTLTSDSLKDLGYDGLIANTGKAGHNSIEYAVVDSKQAKIRKGYDMHNFDIKKADEEKRLVFGWALVSADAAGNQIIDHQGDIVDQDELETGAYEYVLNFRDAGEEHIGSLRKKARMVESVVFTDEKLQAMGIPAGTVPCGWWIGFYVDDDATWERIKNGTYKMFSIEGRAIREPITKEDSDLAKSGSEVAKTFSELMKFNPYHDARGRFTTSSGYTSFTYSPGKSKAHDLAIQREKERHANSNQSHSSKITGKTYSMPKLDSETTEQNRKKAIETVERYFAIRGVANKEKYDEKMKRYLEETDPKEWENRARKTNLAISHSFLSAKTPSEKQKEKADREDYQRQTNAKSRARDKKTQAHQRYEDYKDSLMNKYSTQKNKLGRKDDWYNRTTEAERKKLQELDDARIFRNKRGQWQIAKTFSEIIKFNPYHDSRGRFTTAGAAASFTYKPGQGAMYDKAIAREKERVSAMSNPGKKYGISQEQYDKLKDAPVLSFLKQTKELGWDEETIDKFKKEVNYTERLKERVRQHEQEKELAARKEKAELDARVKQELPGLNQEAIRRANGVSFFEHGSVAAREALRRVDDYKERNKITDDMTDEQKAYMKQREGEYKQLITEYYNDSNSRFANNPSWMVTGPANYNTRRSQKLSNAADKKAQEYEEKLQRFEENTQRKLKSMEPEDKQIARWRNGKWSHGETISADDPLATKKLQAKLDYQKEQQQKMKDANAYYRKNGTMQGFSGFSESTNRNIDTALNSPNRWGEKKPFQTYQLSNNNQQIKSTESRLKQMQKQKETSSNGSGGGGSAFKGGEIIRNTDMNRLQIKFDGIPDAATRQKLKSSGWRWSPKNGVWQRQLTQNAEYSAKQITDALNKSYDGALTFSELLN